MSENIQPNSPKPYHHGDLRNALIAAGLELLNQGGVAALDLRKVARQAGVSHAAPYRHFADKQALLAAIAEDGFEQLGTAMQTALQDAPAQAQPQLLGMLRAYINFALANPALMREMFSGLTIERAAYPSLYASSKKALMLMVQVVEAGQQRGEVVAGDPLELTLVVWSVLHGLAMLLLESQLPPVYVTPEGIEQMTAVCIQFLFSGFAPQT